MSDEFTEQTRAERAFTDLFADRVAGEDFPPLDPAALTKPSRRTWPAWLGAVAAVAAIAVVIAVAVPLWNGRPLPASPSPAEPTPGAWRQTAPIPIGQRYGTVSLWADGAFYLLGGIAHCGLDDRGNPVNATCNDSNPSRGASHADGARYDPATDTWTRLADAPVPIGAGQGVLVGDAIYLLTDPAVEQDVRLLLRYDLSTNLWAEVPQPADPGRRKVQQLLTWGGDLYAATVPANCAEYECAEVIHAWDATANSWTEYASGHPALYYSGGATALTAAGDGFVVLTDTGAAAFIAGAWRDLPSVPFEHPAGPAAGVVATAYTVGDMVVAISGAGQAYTLDLSDPAWRHVPAPATGQRGLIGDESSALFFDGTHVVVDGQLLDPVADSWTDVPTLPNPDWTFGSFAGNGSQVLACYVGPADSFNDCQLLDLGEPTLPEQPPAAVGAWVETAPVPVAARTQAIATWIGDEFLIVGGWGCDGGTAELYPEGSVGCTARPSAAMDGAAYDPAANQWRTIAAPPIGLTGDDSFAVIGQTLYAISSAAQGFWAYDAATDAWRGLPPPPGGVHGGAGATGLLANGEVLLALGDSGQSDAWYDPATRVWTELLAYPNRVYPNEARRVAAFTGKELLLGEPGLHEGDDALRLSWSVFDLDVDGRLATLPSAIDLGATEGLAQPVVNQAATVVLIPPPDGGQAIYRTGGGEGWAPVSEPGVGSGPLVPGLVAGSQVSLLGNLFNPETGNWSYLAALPDGPATSAAQAANSDTLLSCFTLTSSNELSSRCYLLRL